MTKRGLQMTFFGRGENRNGRKPRSVAAVLPAARAHSAAFDRFRLAYPEAGWRNHQAAYEAWQQIVVAQPEMEEGLVIAAATYRLKTGGHEARFIKSAHKYLANGDYQADLGSALSGATEQIVWLMREMQAVWKDRPNAEREDLFWALFKRLGWDWHDGGVIPAKARVVLDEAYERLVRWGQTHELPYCVPATARRLRFSMESGRRSSDDEMIEEATRMIRENPDLGMRVI